MPMTKQIGIRDAISLDFYGPKYKQQLENYHLPEEQLKYTSLPMDAS